MLSRLVVVIFFLGVSSAFEKMTGALLTTLSIDNNHPPSSILSMDSGAAATHEDGEQNSKPSGVNLPLLVSEISSSQQPLVWHAGGSYDSLDVVLGPPHMTAPHEIEGLLLNSLVKSGTAAPNHKCARRNDSIWGAWFFFSFYFKPALTDKAKTKLGPASASSQIFPSMSFDKSDLRLDRFMRI